MIAKDVKIPEVEYIDRVGVELEGAWKAERGIRPYADGSVHIDMAMEGEQEEETDHDSDCDCDSCYEVSQNRENRRRASGLIMGEICSSPAPLAETVSWILNSYPDRTNSSCGLHVHVSVKNRLRYAQLMDEDFWNHFRNKYGDWAKRSIKTKLFWDRWNGQNHFCMPEFIPDKQCYWTNKGYSRYTALNYAYNVRDRRTGRARKTIEFRALPMFKSKYTAATAVAKFVGLVDDYLSNRKPGESAKEISRLVENEEAQEQEINIDQINEKKLELARKNGFKLSDVKHMTYAQVAGYRMMYQRRPLRTFLDEAQEIWEPIQQRER